MLEAIGNRSRYYDLINLQYGVCFGFIFSSLFSLDEVSYSIHIDLQFNIPHITFLALIVYFFLDWFLFNVLVNHSDPSTWKAFLLSIGVWALGLIILTPRATNLSEETKTILIGTYFLLAGWFKLSFYFKGWYTVNEEGQKERKKFSDGTHLVGSFFSIIQIILSVFAIIATVAYVIWGNEFKVIDGSGLLLSNGSLLIYVAVFIALKIANLSHLNILFSKNYHP